MLAHGKRSVHRHAVKKIKEAFKGFTLIELLIAMSMIGILSWVVLYAVSPMKNRADALDVVRKSYAKEMKNAIVQQLIEQGQLPNASQIPQTQAAAINICRYLQCAGGGASCWCGDSLIPNFLAALPVDHAETDPFVTGYKIYMNNGFVAVEPAHLGAEKEDGESASSAVSNIFTTIDGSGTARKSSVAIGNDGFPVISHYASGIRDLLVVKCGNADCSSGNTVTTVDSVGSVGIDNDIAVPADGLPVISEFDLTNIDLKVVKCGNAACSSGNTVTTVDSAGSVGEMPSIAIGGDGLPVMSYMGVSNLTFLKCGNATCTSGNVIIVVDTTAGTGWWSSIAVPADGLPVMSAYASSAGGIINVVKCGNATCSSGNTVTMVDTVGSANNGSRTSIAIGADGLPIMSVWDGTNGDLKVIKCGNAACSAANTVTVVDSEDNVGEWNSIAIGTDNLPVISYNSSTDGRHKVLKCGNAACSSGNTITTVDVLADLEDNSIAVPPDGLPVIMESQISGTLKMLKCGNAACSAL
jgi:prepilin-type N-terminal cleavage/methylation domain-containing protein